MKISSYGYIFNARKFSFPLEETVTNFCAFFDEVVCVTVESEDDTRQRLRTLESQYPNFKVIDSNIQILGNNRFDGQLKTLALNYCTNKIKVICDYDEKFPLHQKSLWIDYAIQLSSMTRVDVDGIFLPVIDLYKNEECIRADQNIGIKFRMHNENIVKRGVIKSAELTGGFFDTSKSDSTEPLRADGSLGKFISPIVDMNSLNPLKAANLNFIPHVFHYGYLDLARRTKIGREFWKQAWEERSGKTENVATEVAEISSFPAIYHNLKLP